MCNDLQVDHIGYAVRNMEKALTAFKKLGFDFGDTVADNDRNLEICFGSKDGYRLELLAPLSDAPTPADTWLKKVGPTPYHICYRAADLDKTIEKLKAAGGGYRLVSQPSKAIAFGGRRVAFLFHLQIGLIEIVEGDRNEGIHNKGDPAAAAGADEEVP